jgi:hypothetical protein
MKIRYGFVSNSSSSSFVVKYRSGIDGPKIFLNKEQLKKLKKYGFKYTNVNNPYYVDVDLKNGKVSTSLKVFGKWDIVNLSYSVICNQDDVIYFLLTNKIPFVALCHYDEELVVWDGESEWFFEFPNLVEQFSRKIGKETFSEGNWISALFAGNGIKVEPKKYKVNEWLEKERKMVEDLV